MFREFLNHLVQMVALVHSYILTLNDNSGAFLSDKKLHFLIIGFVGLMILFVIYPLFKWLASKKSLIIVAWIYTFTVLIALTLLIEIGQDVTGTGILDFADIMSGLLGFIVMSFIPIGLVYLLNYLKEKKKREQQINTVKENQ